MRSDHSSQTDKGINPIFLLIAFVVGLVLGKKTTLNNNQLPDVIETVKIEYIVGLPPVIADLTGSSSVMSVHRISDEMMFKGVSNSFALASILIPKVFSSLSLYTSEVIKSPLVKGLLIFRLRHFAWIKDVTRDSSGPCFSIKSDNGVLFQNTLVPYGVKFTVGSQSIDTIENSGDFTFPYILVSRGLVSNPDIQDLMNRSSGFNFDTLRSLPFNPIEGLLISPLELSVFNFYLKSGFEIRISPLTGEYSCSSLATQSQWINFIDTL